MWSSLSRPPVFRAAIDKLLRAAVRDDDGELAVLQRDGDALARRLAREFAERRWVQQPARRRIAMLDRPRELITLDVVDRVVHAAVGGLLVQWLEPRLPASLYSYRPRRGPGHVVAAVVAALRAERARGRPLRERGLYVMRFDVSKYGDTLPVDAASELWPMLRGELAGVDAWLVDTICAMVRCDGDGEPRDIGVAIGSPIANPVLNLYLVDLDRTLETMARLYVRFGDDCLLACESAAAADAARAEVERVLARKRLRVTRTSRCGDYWNAAGRPGDGDWRGTSHVSYVGADIAFGGTVRLKLARRHELLRAVDERIAGLAKLLDDGADARARAAELCAALRPAFDRASPWVLPELARVVTLASCRRQLAEMDREIAVAVAAAATRRRGAAAFREVAWRELLAIGLPSLVKLRNRGVA